MHDHHDPHEDLHHEAGALAGEHVGRSANPVIKVRDLAWLEFEKPDLAKSEAFAHAFGFSTLHRTPTELTLRGSDAGAPCVIIRKAERSRFLGPAFHADGADDLLRLANATDSTVRRLPEHLGGLTVDVREPAGALVRVVTDTIEHPAMTSQAQMVLNFGHEAPRTNATQRPLRAPATVQRLGHVVLQSTKYIESLNWFLDHLGLIVSDFLYFPGQRERGPTMSFIRCDRGSVPTDHHTLAMTLGPRNRYVHSAYQVSDLDALAAGGEHLKDLGYQRSWGIGRHIQGSQIFDYWRDPDGFLVEHFTDGDMFDCTLEPGWGEMTASNLAQWGPPATADFLGVAPGKESAKELLSMLAAVRGDTEFDLNRLTGLMKVARS
jgi:catechol 2,3-dioxygenase-like lactoylglutathione lyase family enzyme